MIVSVLKCKFSAFPRHCQAFWHFSFSSNKKGSDEQGLSRPRCPHFKVNTLIALYIITTSFCYRLVCQLGCHASHRFQFPVLQQLPA